MSDLDYEQSCGKVITTADIYDEKLLIRFNDETAIWIYDDGQGCCEWRHMSTDDDLSSLIGHHLVSIEQREGPMIEDECGDCHDICFVIIQTDVGSVTLVNHNEHNGYYGGFCLVIKTVE